MTDLHSVKLWTHWHESATKLDYFVLGISAALTAYVGQNLHVGPLGLNPPTAELLALLLFSLSVLAGLNRLRSGVANLMAQGAMMEQKERAGALKTLIKTGGGVLIVDGKTGDTFSVEQAKAAAEAAGSAIASLEPQHAKWKHRAEKAYEWRDRLLIGGVALFAISKLWAAVIAA